MFKLVISDDEGKTTTVPLVRDEITIGRKEGNTIRLTDRNVSRRHARLQKQNGHYLLHDLGSYNGTVINGARLAETRPVKHGDQILIGDYKLAILEEATSQIAAPPPGPNDTLEAIPVPAAPPPPSPAQTAPAIPSAMATVQGMPAPTAQPSQPPTRISVPPASPAPAPSAATYADDVPDYVREMRLVFLGPAGVPAPVTLEKLPMILGRSEAADVALPFSSISREHARILCLNGEVYIEDLGSSNGVTVNGNRVTRNRLSPGDLVTMGVVEFRVARRGDSTVLIDRTVVPGSRKRSPMGLIAAGLGVVALVGGIAVFALRPSGNTTAANAASGQELPTQIATTPAPAPAASPPVAAPAPPSATANPPPATAIQQSANVADPGPSTVSTNDTPPAARSRGTTTVRDPLAQPAARTAARIAPPAPVPTPAPAPARSVRPTSTPPPTTTAPTLTPRVSAPPPAAAASSGPSGIEAARACLRTGDNACAVNALRNASSEPELGLLAVTLRAMNNRAEALRVMRRYLSRFPDGPRAESFRNFVDNQ
jgi:pSer/pThr/pTyr-binding forkhead associated (FHA) protein